MHLPSVLESARYWVKKSLSAGGNAIDATAGNGYDTLFLAQHVGPNGQVFVFDIQEAALAKTRERLDQAGLLERAQLFLQSHHHLGDSLPPELKGQIHAVMFNLGYLPHGDPTIITQPETTIPALNIALEWLISGGVITTALYTGHPGGQEECDQIIQWASSLSPKSYQVMWQQFINRNHPPSLLVIEKR